MELVLFINSFYFIMPMLLSILIISALETLLTMIHHIKAWETIQSFKMGMKDSSPFQQQQLQEYKTLPNPKITITSPRKMRYWN